MRDRIMSLACATTPRERPLRMVGLCILGPGRNGGRRMGSRGRAKDEVELRLSRGGVLASVLGKQETEPLHERLLAVT